ncbi:hypothetical protein, partial [Halomonas marinisediminis]
MNARDWQLEEFAIGAEASRMARPRRGLTAILLLIIALAGVGLVWAGWVTIEEVSRADGRVVPS